MKQERLWLIMKMKTQEGGREVILEIMMAIVDLKIMTVIVIMIAMDNLFNQYEEALMMMRRWVDYVKQCEQAGSLRVGTCESWNLHTLLCCCQPLLCYSTLLYSAQ